jgi:hypothetical protein
MSRSVADIRNVPRREARVLLRIAISHLRREEGMPRDVSDTGRASRPAANELLWRCVQMLIVSYNWDGVDSVSQLSCSGK